VIEDQIALLVVVHPDFPEEAFSICIRFHHRCFHGQVGRIDWFPVVAESERGRCKSSKQTQY
jgi:hypothetical protein